MLNWKLEKILKAVIFMVMLSVLSTLLWSGNATAKVLTIDDRLSQYIREALRNNPELESWQARVEAAEKHISQAGTWKDPLVSFSLMNLPTNTFDFNQEPMTGAWINISQSIPLNGHYRVQREIAKKERDILLSGHQNRELTIARDVARTWYEWSYWNKAVAVTDSMIALLDDVISVAYRKYETGSGLQADLLRLQTERTTLEDRRLNLEQVAKSTGQNLAVLLGREPTDIPESPVLLPEQFDEIVYELLLDDLIHTNPHLQSAETNQEIAQENVVLHERLWWPDLKLSAGYGYREDSDPGMERPDFFSVSAGITIPIFGASKQGKAVEESRLREKQALADRRRTELELKLALQNLIDKDKRLAEQITLYDEGILPQAEATLSTVLSSFSVGRVDVDAVLMSQTALLKARLARLARIRDRFSVRAELAALVGEQNGLDLNDN